MPEKQNFWIIALGVIALLLLWYVISAEQNNKVVLSIDRDVYVDANYLPTEYVYPNSNYYYANYDYPVDYNVDYTTRYAYPTYVI